MLTEIGTSVKVYLDNCCYNRPFDDQASGRVHLESLAKLHIQRRIRAGELDLVWSYILDFEAGQNPFAVRKRAIMPWRDIAAENVDRETESILELAEALQADGVKSYDALHIACAAEARCDCFITTDRRLLNIAEPPVRVVNPVTFVVEMEDGHED